MADHPLRSATDRRLGRLLPYQPANQTQAHPSPINLWPLVHANLWFYVVLIPVSRGYTSVKGRLPTRYSPVRRFPLLASTEVSACSFSLDLHVLSTPPAFILSQDQTLNLYIKTEVLIPWLKISHDVFSFEIIVLKLYGIGSSILPFFMVCTLFCRLSPALTIFLHYLVFNVHSDLHRPVLSLLLLKRTLLWYHQAFTKVKNIFAFFLRILNFILWLHAPYIYYPIYLIYPSLQQAQLTPQRDLRLMSIITATTHHIPRGNFHHIFITEYAL